jgi:hypothetical protein
MKPELPDNLPYLSEIIGRVIGVGFEPGKSEVVFKSKDKQVTIPATAQQVESALKYRATEVRALILRHGDQSRLLRLEDAALPRYRADPETYVFKKWDGLLRRLAQC